MIAGSGAVGSQRPGGAGCDCDRNQPAAYLHPVPSEPTSDPLPPYDPYETRPSLLQRYADQIAAAVVFVATVLLTVLSFPPYNVPEAAYVMLVPGIYWAYRRPSLKRFAWTLGAAQVVAWTVILSWLHHVSWVGLFLLGPVVGVWIGTWYLAAWWVMPRMLGQPTFNRLTLMMGLCGAWVLVEWTRTWLLGGFPWLPLAASQWQRTSILQIATITGSYGVSFVLVAVNIGFAAYAHRLFREQAVGFNKRSQEFFLAVFLLMGCLAVHFQEAFARSKYTVPLARVAFVQPDIPQTLKWDPAKAQEIVGTLQQTTASAIATLPEVILWPEASTPWSVRNDPTMKAFVEGLARGAKVPFLIGSIAIEDQGTPAERWYNAALVIDPQTGVRSAYYAKRHLVPFGEYVPLKPVLGWLRKVVPIGDDFSAGKSAAPLIVNIEREPLLFGPLICFEDIFPQLARDPVQLGAHALVVVTNNAWFGEGGAAYQHAAHSVLRAVEMRRPVLRCGNAGWSGWIDEFGTIRAVLTRDRAGEIHTDLKSAQDGTIYFRGAAAVNVTRDSRWINVQTFYSQHGDWFVVVCAVLGSLSVALLLIGARSAGSDTKK